MKHICILAFTFLVNVLVAQNTLDSLEQLIPKKEGIEKIDLLNQVSNFYWSISPDKGITFADTAYQAAEKLRDKSRMATALQNKGICYWAKSEYYTALDYYKKSISIFEEINEKKGIAAVYSNMGIIYDNLTDYENALNYYFKSLKLSDDDEKLIDLKTKTLGNIGLVYLGLKNYQQALTYTQQAIDLCEKSNDTKSIAAQLNTMGRIYDEQKGYEKALKFYHDALDINLSNQNNYGTTICLYNIGYVKYKLKQYDESMDYFQKSHDLSQIIDDKIGVLLALKSIGLIYKEHKDITTTVSYLDKALAIAKNINAKEERLELYKDYYNVYKSFNKLKPSLSYFEKYVSLKDSIYNEKSSKQIAEIQTKYELDKKQKENELLRQNNIIKDLEIERQTTLRNSFIALFLVILLCIIILYNRYNIKKQVNKTLSQKNRLIGKQRKELIHKNGELNRQYEQLKLLNAMKDKFFKIISHDLKGPFSGILGVTELILKDYHSFDDPTRIELLNEVDKASRSTYELLTNLLTWAQSQTGEIKILKRPINLKTLIEDCIRLYGSGASAKNIDFDIDIPDDITLSLDNQTSQTFIGNLISNAIKFTPNGGLITINCTDQNDLVMIRIIDTGVGMTPDIINKLFKIDESISTLGTNREKGTGLGLILCKEFIEKNDGEISVKSEVGKGSEFTVLLPKFLENQQ